MVEAITAPNRELHLKLSLLKAAGQRLAAGRPAPRLTERADAPDCICEPLEAKEE